MAEDAGIGQTGKSYNKIVTSVSMGSDIVMSQGKAEVFTRCQFLRRQYEGDRARRGCWDEYRN